MSADHSPTGNGATGSTSQESSAAYGADGELRIVFGSDDNQFFSSGDPKARFEALRYVLLPRLLAMFNEAVALVREIYSVDALADSAIAYYPQPRSRRDTEIGFFYEAVAVGLTGKRTKGKWIAVQRKDGTPAQILPYRFEFILDTDGLSIQLDNYWLKGMSISGYRAGFDFLLANECRVHNLLHFSGSRPSFDWAAAGGPLTDSQQLFERLIKHRSPRYGFGSVTCARYPVSIDDAWQAIIGYVGLFPIYHAYLEMAMGREPSFNQLYERLCQWTAQRLHGPGFHLAIGYRAPSINAVADEKIRQVLQSIAYEPIKVVPSVRWLVFQRDGFRCVSCGRSANEGAVLHVDHILPKSKGGLDVFDNYQTLCRECNIGKSNKSSENLHGK